jgi:2-polyprenyl-6-methoxyphenol hydroxylase-like FAD-dependent oxidoreductase
MALRVVVVGGGIAGSSLATVLARQGHEVVVLERDVEYRDHVRGEVFVPWGVAEAQHLGLHDALLGAGAHHSQRFILYDPAVPVEAAEAGAVDTTAVLPGVPGVLNVRHPVACAALTRAAIGAGATVVQGVDSIELVLGEHPTVSFTVAGQRQVEEVDLVVGADGRNSFVRRTAGIEMQKVPASHLISGLLVEGADDWPIGDDAAATVGDVSLIGLPQGDGMVRLYVNHELDTMPRFSGPGGGQRLIEAFSTPVMPQNRSLAGARPAGPCATFRAEETWCPAPSAPGVVLVGDAAGYVDPIAGQGLSIAMRDVRLIGEALDGAGSVDGDTFTAYASDRVERLRRIRFVDDTLAALLTVFGPEGDARRLTALGRMQEDPVLGLWFASMFVGPYNVPEESFEPSVPARLFAA